MDSEKVKEIKKGLECHTQNEIEDTCKYCLNCPAGDWDYEQECTIDLFQKTITAINELESENERLLNEKWDKEDDLDNYHIENKQLKDRIAELEKENEILQGTKDRLTFADRIKLVNNAREKALKQFAERLKEISCEMYLKEQLHCCIDETLKEFLGEQQ